MHKLNECFTNPSIVKVMHGADSDVLWLQRDFGVFIVNMFDTGQAARLLEYPGFSLAYLLKLHCSVQPDKQYQLADWRVRPLGEALLKYAREDTHYLLFVYDKMKNELLAQSGAAPYDEQPEGKEEAEATQVVARGWQPRPPGLGASRGRGAKCPPPRPPCSARICRWQEDK